MCDCYWHPCKVCGLQLPIHLADFNTGRDEIEVYCRKHIPKGEDADLDIWLIKDNAERLECGTTRIGIKSLTENARRNREGNAPNLGDAELLER